MNQFTEQEKARLFEKTYTYDELEWYSENIKKSFFDFLNKYIPVECRKPFEINLIAISLSEKNYPRVNTTGNINTQIFEIVFDVRMFSALYNYANKYIKHEQIFSNLQNSQIPRRHVSSYIVLLWCHFICLHELAHIVLGHIDYRFMIKQKKHEPSNDENYLLALEAQADTLAMEFMIMSTKDLKNHFNASAQEQEYSLMMSLCFLFDFLAKFEGADRKAGHPDAIERISLLAISIARQNKTAMRKAIVDYFAMLVNFSNMDIISHFQQYELVGYIFDEFIEKNPLLKTLVKINGISKD